MEIEVVRAVGIVAALVFFLREAAGRMAPRMVFAPFIFLVTRTPVLIAWGIGAAGLYALIASQAAANGKAPDAIMLTGLSVFCGLGFAALVVGPLFAIRRYFAPKPDLPLSSRETIVDTFLANHWMRREARGGKLMLTDQRLGFVPHRFNVQLDVWSLPIEEVRGARAEGTSLLVLDTDRGEEVFVVTSPETLARVLIKSAAARRAACAAP